MPFRYRPFRCRLKEELVEPLIQAWHSQRTMPELVVQLSLPAHMIEVQWRQLKALGRLPRIRRAVGNIRKSDNLAEKRKHKRKDGPSPHDAHNFSLTTGKNDPLLAKLIEVHPELAPDPSNLHGIIHT